LRRSIAMLRNYCLVMAMRSSLAVCEQRVSNLAAADRHIHTNICQ
jgi:hypothetical protein